ncbi:Ig-like domain-containing protein [Yersinia ruckeri]|nr:Ig-like domain-containing protein [Yersinia ruckeri]
MTTAKIATLTTDKAVAVDDGKAAITFTATVKDAGGAVVPNVEVKFATTKDGKLSASTATTDEHGVATVTLTSRVAGKVDVSAKTAVDTEGKTTSVTFVVASTIAVDYPEIFANGFDLNYVRLSLRDGELHPVTDAKIEFVSSLSGVVISNVINQGNGVYIASISGTRAGELNVRVRCNGVMLSSLVAYFKLKPVTAILEVSFKGKQISSPYAVKNQDDQFKFHFFGDGLSGGTICLIYRRAPPRSETEWRLSPTTKDTQCVTGSAHIDVIVNDAGWYDGMDYRYAIGRKKAEDVYVPITDEFRMTKK